MTQIPTLTVFTPSYNRAHTLVRTYESLCRQTSKDFEWLIVDDGSTDGTEQLVFCWLAKNNDFRIRYIKKDNGGLHTGYNAAIACIRTELNVCIDSDDFMPDTAVETIIKNYVQIKDNDDVAGIIGLDYNMEGHALGGFFQSEGILHFHDVHSYHHHDVKIAVKTALLRAVPVMMTFKGEKNFNPAYYYYYLDTKYKFYFVNANFCNVDYQATGMSNNILWQYRNSPHSFAQDRRFTMTLPYYSFAKHFRNNIHYVSSCIFAKEWNGIATSPKPVMTICAIPFGILLNLYIRYKTRRICIICPM